MKIVDYYVVFAGDCESIAALVVNMMKQGWQPFGSLTINDTCTCQPMVVYAEHEPSWEAMRNED